MFVDTNILVRHLTGDPAEQAGRASRFLADASVLLLADVVVAEIVYVLASYYRASRTEVATALRSILAFEAIRVVDAALLHRAIEIYEGDRLDFPDAYLVACAERAGIGTIVSFDRSIDRVATVDRIEPP
jgi:predicted nucleic acid-binding protein